MIDEAAIRRKVEGRHYDLTAHADWFTPAGRRRNVPMYEVTIENEYLGKLKTIKSKCASELEARAREQLTKWHEQEIRARIREERADAKAAKEEEAADLTAEARRVHQEFGCILASTLDVDDRLDWEEFFDRTSYPAFEPKRVVPFPTRRPEKPKRGLIGLLVPPLWKRKLARWEEADRKWQADESDHAKAAQKRAEKHRADYERNKAAFLERQTKHNAQVAAFKEAFESGNPATVVEYLENVFERSVYPECFFREYSVGYDEHARTAVIDISLPTVDQIPDALEYRFNARRNELQHTSMKPKDLAALYDEAVKQCILRTAHEVFEAIYTDAVEAVVVNGWVTALDKATGHDKTNCTISLLVNREDFEKLNLDRISATECLKALKALMAGPLSEVAPVQPKMQLNRDDDRFVTSEAVLDGYDEATNLAEVPWEEFEHLVRELFGKLFSTDGAEVSVTRASADGGVDAIAFDPDPIRGGKYVIQAKRYTKVVPVSAVRDLYGTMINEGATKGILVTTAHYGRDSRGFAQDKPITLIDGGNLVYLLEEHGHKVRIDVEAARRARSSGAS